MGFRDWLGNTLFNIDKVVDGKLQERLGKYNTLESQELLSFRMLENQIWAKGNADRILEFYKTTVRPANFNTDRLLFWNWVGGIKVPKLHYPAPEALLNSMKSLIFGSEPDIEFVTEKDSERADIEKVNTRLVDILEENNINEFYQNGAVMESYSGTIAVKFILDKAVSNLPIMQLYPQERIELVTKYNRVIEIIFKDYYRDGKDRYLLKSIYGKGYIDYILVNDKNKAVPLATIPELADLTRQEFTPKILMATYKKNRTNNVEFPDSGYGGSDFEGIIDLFHQIDEIYSTMALYIRRTRPILTLNEKLIPTSADGRKQVIPKEYEYDIIKLREADSAVNVKDQINRDIPELNLDVYLTAIKALQRSIYQKVGYSAVTANLDEIGANLSGKALNELEKATLILYQNKVKLWDKFLKDTFKLALVYDDILKHSKIITDYKDYTLNVSFADYHSDGMAERVKTFGEAYRNMGVDIETMLNEIWGDKLEQEQIDQMVINVKLENGIPILPNQLQKAPTPIVTTNEEEQEEA